MGVWWYCHGSNVNLAYYGGTLVLCYLGDVSGGTGVGGLGSVAL